MSSVYRRGDLLFLYAQFKDEVGKPIAVNSPMVRIMFEKDDSIQPLLDWQPLSKMSTNEYFFNFPIPDDADYSLYEIIYAGEYNGQTAQIMESFHVVPHSDTYTNVIKIYGFINQAKVGYPLINAKVKVFSNDDNTMISEGYTNDDGRWETFLYPGKYQFTFEKYGFNSEDIYVEIGSEYNEMQFDNVVLESTDSASKGNGSFTISDRYVTKDAMALNGLQVNAYNILNPNFVIASGVTDDNGEWELFLDPGMYLLKVQGNSLAEDFNLTFRLKVNERGEFTFENLTHNIAVPTQNNFVGTGSGSKSVSDFVLDKNGNPIVDVQLSIYLQSNPTVLVAEDYTDPSGKWQVFLNPGTYMFEYYHPEFHEFSEVRTI